ncbi:unnamed protein product, partial [Rotaria sp. Silwood2]
SDRAHNDNETQSSATETNDKQQLHTSISKKIRVPHPLTSSIEHNLVRNIWVALLSLLFLSTLFNIIALRYYDLFKIDKINDENVGTLTVDIVHLLKKCERDFDYRKENLSFAPFALSLVIIFSWSIKRDKQRSNICYGRPGLLSPIKPFHTENRFITAAVFGIIFYAIVKIFEELFFGSYELLNRGVLIELMIRLGTSIIVGLRYYPVLASLQLRNIIVRFFACVYVLGDIGYTIIREGSCMGFIPLSGSYSVLEEAKLRMELGSWFIIYGFIKNAPYFLFLAYIAAELCVRFVYDSIYILLKEKQSIWSAFISPLDKLEQTKYYVAKLLRRRYSSSSLIINQQNTMTNNQNDKEHKSKQQNVNKQSSIKKFLEFFYNWDDDFRYTTIATCTYTVAFVFLYYLACTSVFLYMSRTKGHITFIKSYIEYSANIVVSKSLRYSGFLIGYMAWGFVICFHLILLLLISIRILLFKIRHIELILAIIVPVLIIYVLTMLSMKSIGKFLFIQNIDKKPMLKCGKLYEIFAYFSFFADCFIGIASCIIRLVQATFLNVIYMARIDYSFLGRPLENLDVGFATYVSYLHVEKQYSNPIVFAFCNLLLDETYRKPGNYDNEESFTPRYDSHVKGNFKEQKECQLTERRTESLLLTRKLQKDPVGSTNYINHNTHKCNPSTMSNTSLHSKSNHSVSLSISEKSLTKVKYCLTDDLSSISIAETTQKSKLKTTSITFDNSQAIDGSKCKSRKFTISNNEIKIHTNDSSAIRQFFDTAQEQSYSTTFSQSSKINIENQADKDKDIDLSQQTIVTTEKNKQAIETKKKKLQQNSIKKKISNKSNQDISNSISSSEDNDRESIDQTSKDISFNNTYLNTNQSLKHQQETTSISHDTIDQRIPKVSNIIPNTQVKKITTKHHDRSILTKEQCPTLRETTINSLTSIPRRSRKNNFYFLLLISPNNLSVGISEQSKDSFLLCDQNNTNENNHHDIVISTNKTQTGILNRPHSIFESMPLLSSHSTRPISEQIPTKQNNIDNITAVNKEESKKIDRRKIARNRWYLAYTIIRNSYLFDLRKNLKEKCNRLYSQSNKSMNETLFRTMTINRETEPVSNVLFNTSNIQRRKNKIPEPYEPQSSTHHPNLSSMSSDDEDPASPAEEYVAFFLQQSYIYDIAEHQTLMQSAHTVPQESSELPSLQPISTTNQSITDNPPKTSKLMNFDQHMQAWYENEIRKFQNKQPHCYIYTSKYDYHK